MSFTKIKKVDYLYEMNYADIDYRYTYSYYKENGWKSYVLNIC